MKQQLLTEKAVASLLNSGWTPQRQIPVDEVVRSEELCGFDLTPDARQYLAELATLRVKFDSGEWILFDADRSAPFYNANSVARLEQRLGLGRLCRLGQSAMTDVLMTATGRVIIIDADEELYCELPSVESLLNHLALGPEADWLWKEIGRR